MYTVWQAGTETGWVENGTRQRKNDQNKQGQDRIHEKTEVSSTIMSFDSTTSTCHAGEQANGLAN